MTATIHFFEVFDEEVTALKKYLPEAWDFRITSKTIQETEDLPLNPEIISIRTQSVIPLEWKDCLKGVLSRSAGFDHLLAFQELTGSSAQSGHLFRYSGRAVAEHAVMMMLCLLRKLPIQMESMSGFHRDGLTGKECLNRTLAVFGVGDIGHALCKLGQGLGMEVIGVDLNPAKPDLTYVSRDEALSRADVICCSMNLNETNREYFTPELLQTCREGAVFINVARGEFCRHTTLLHLLEQGTLSGVGLDVLYDEPLMSSALRNSQQIKDPEYTALRQLMTRPDVILTPHNAFNTLEAVDRKSSQTVEQLNHYFKTGTFKTHTPSEHS